MLTLKQIRERSPEWVKFIRNHDRALLNRKIIRLKNRPKPELKEVKQ